MKPVSMPALIETIDPARFTEELDLIALSVGEASLRFRPVSRLADANEVARQLADQQGCHADMDARTQGAYLMNRLSWDICAVIGWLDLNRLSVEDFLSDRVGVVDTRETEVEVGEVFHYVRYRWWLPELNPVSAPPTPDVLGRYLVDRLEPFVEEIRRQTRLGKAALWRLLADALAASYLNTGKRLGLTGQAMARAAAIIEAVGKPLANDQWHFKEYCVDAGASPTGQALGDWFRVRGGCCRYYTLPDSDYCGTCVHLDEPEREARFQRYLCTVAVSPENT